VAPDDAGTEAGPVGVPTELRGVVGTGGTLVGDVELPQAATISATTIHTYPRRLANAAADRRSIRQIVLPPAPDYRQF
jgi:hypothetical protein